MDPIRIELERSGGVAGISLRSSIDTGALPPDEAQDIARLVDRIEFADLARRPHRPTRGADRFQYDLTVQQGATRYRLSLPEGAIPTELKPLLERLIARAKGG
jgi:hypothetical protein